MFALSTLRVMTKPNRERAIPLEYMLKSVLWIVVVNNTESYNSIGFIDSNRMILTQITGHIVKSLAIALPCLRNPIS